MKPDRFALLRQLAPAMPRIAVLVNSNSFAKPIFEKNRQPRVPLANKSISCARETNGKSISAFRAMVQHRTDALLVAHDPFLFSRREQVVTLTAYFRIPESQFREFVLAGGLMSYGSKLTDNYRLAGVYDEPNSQRQQNWPISRCRQTIKFYS